MKRLLFNQLGCALLGTIAAWPVILNHNIAIAQSQTSSLAYLNGTWEGTYRCLQGLAKLKLDIKVNNEKDIDAVFSFSEHPSNPGNPSGQFTMKGQYTVANTPGTADSLHLDGTNWIQRPRGYKTVNLYGNVDASKDTIQGDVQSPGCTKFEVSKINTQNSKPVLTSTASSTPAPKQDAPVVSNAKGTLNGPERQVASYHKAMETTDKTFSHFCAAERIMATKSVDVFDPKGRNRERLNIYLAIAKGLYKLDTSKLVYKTVYTDSVGEGRAIVTVAGPVLLHTSSNKYFVIMYHKFQPLGKAWIRLIKENGQWKICLN